MKSQWVYLFQVASDGTLVNGQPYCDLHVPYGAIDSGADGMTVDSLGRVYVATRIGVQFCDQAGRVNGIISKPEAGWMANITFAGPDKHTLFAAVGGHLFRRTTKATGVRSADAPITPPAPRL
jgi:sugar lactone lactonase YvrE